MKRLQRSGLFTDTSPVSQSSDEANAGSKRLHRMVLRDQAREVMRASIINGEFQGGTLYPVSYFSSRLGVSATPIREALLDLVKEGLVEVVRNRGFRIPTLSAQDLDEIFELRLLLEVPSMGRLVGRMTPIDIAECNDYLRQMDEYTLAGDPARYLSADRAFHIRLFQCLGNKRLADIFTTLRNQTPVYGLPELAMPGRMTDSSREHRRLLEAIVQGQSEKAKSVITMHLKHSRGIWRAGAEP